MAIPRLDPRVLIDGDGNFNHNIEGLLNLGSENGRVAVVSIMGIQDHGNSTLLNACLSTAFPVMDARQGMYQTTKGIWIAKWTPRKYGPKILVIDMEGSDGSERGDDNTFEKKAAFALATSTTVIFNLECDNTNLLNGSSRPLLRTVFKVMVRKFTNAPKVNLLFVLRDKPPETKLKILSKKLKDEIRALWKAEMKNQSKPGNLKRYFDIKVMAMSHYTYDRRGFDNDVATLRKKIIKCSARRETAARSFVRLAQTNWNQIDEDRILNLQLNKVTVDEVYCNRYADDKYERFCENKIWLRVKKDVGSRADVRRFGKKVSKLLGKYLNKYDKETEYFDKTARKRVRKTLTERLLQVVEPTYVSLVNQMSNKILKKFEDELKATGALTAKETTYIKQFQGLLQDAAIRQATGWNHAASEHLSKLVSEIESKTNQLLRINEQLRQNKCVTNQIGKRQNCLEVAATVSSILQLFLSCIDFIANNGS